MMPTSSALLSPQEIFITPNAKAPVVIPKGPKKTNRVPKKKRRSAK